MLLLGLTKSMLHSAYDDPSFEAPLLNSLILKRGVGNPTFTRSDTANYSATVTDFEGLIRPVLNGEARFEYARRVENKLFYSETFSSVYWEKVTSGTTYVTDATLNKTVARVDMSAGIGAGIRQNTYIPAFSQGVFQVKLRGNSGGELVQLSILGLAYNNISVGFVTLTTNWTIYTVIKIDNTKNIAGVGISRGVTSGIFYITDTQLEDVTGQSNQAPSKYYSKGVLSAPYHGAGVDGVGYETTTNGNTVTNNVVTENGGTPLADSTLKEYLAEGSRQNLALYSSDLSVWTPTAVTRVQNFALSPTGTLTAAKIYEDGTTSAHSVYGLVPLVSGTIYTYSVYLKYISETWAVIKLSDGITNWDKYLNLTTGVLGGSAFTAPSAASVTALPDGWYRLSITQAAGRTATGNIEVGMAKANATRVFTGDGSSGILAWGAQLEAGSSASSYIPTGASAVTRGLSLLKGIVSGNISNTLFTGQIEYTPTAATTSYIWGSYVDADNYTLLLYSTGSFIFRKRIAGTNYDASIAITQTVGTKYKIAWRLSPITGMDIFVNGTKGTGNANTSSMQLGTYFYIGNDGNGVESAWGYLRYYKNNKVAKTDTYLKAITT